MSRIRPIAERFWGNNVSTSPESMRIIRATGRDRTAHDTGISGGLALMVERGAAGVMLDALG